MQKKRMLLLILCLTGLLAAIQVQAQFDLPPQVREAAIQAAQQAIPSLGRPDSWEFQRLSETSDSSLGCPLVTGSTLPSPVTPYRVILVYGADRYTVYVSTDGTRTQLCDDKFGEAMTAPQTISPTDCVLTASVDGALNSRLDASSPIAEAPYTAGTTLAAVGRSSDNAWYQTQVGAVTGWIPATSVTAGAGCDTLPVTASFNADAQANACSITPLSSFSNVRAQPDTNAPQVAQIFENTVWQVQAQNSTGQWYYIQPGWVALSVSTVSGDCSNIPVNDALAGTGNTGADASLSGAQILAEYTCPLGFVGYMPPGIKIGPATARIGDGTTPNTLRSQPVANDSIGERIGTIQPGRTLDTVLNGPACSDGFVWWFVEIDGQTGWTAESNFAAQEYYMLPTAGNEVLGAAQLTPTSAPIVVTATPEPVVVTATPQVETAPVAATTAPTVEAAPVIEAQPMTWRGVRVLETGLAVRKVLFNADETLLYVLAGDGTGIQLWNPGMGVPLAERITPDSPIVDMALVGTNLLTLHTDNSLRTWDTNTLTETGRANDVGAALFDLDGDNVLLVKGGCAQTDANGCVSGSVEVRELATGALLRGQPAHPAQPIQVIVSADDAYLASSSVDGVQVWELQSGAFVTAFGKDPQQPINHIAFSPDSSRLLWGSCAEASLDANNQAVCTRGDVRLFDIASGQAVLTLNDHTGNVFNVAFSPDGTRFATAGADSDVLLYDTATGEQLEQYTEHAGNANALLFNTDGSLLISGGDDGRVILRQIDAN